MHNQDTKCTRCGAIADTRCWRRWCRLDVLNSWPSHYGQIWYRYIARTWEFLGICAVAVSKCFRGGASAVLSTKRYRNGPFFRCKYLDDSFGRFSRSNGVAGFPAECGEVKDRSVSVRIPVMNVEYILLCIQYACFCDQRVFVYIRFCINKSMWPHSLKRILQGT